MADILVKGVMTEDGVRQIDYTALANLPVIDSKLSQSSMNAVQNKVVSKAISDVETKIDTDIATLSNYFTENGTVSNSEKLGGQAPDYYATATDVAGKAPTGHASSTTIYGIGASGSYGHVKLSDSTESDSGVNDGVAATPAAVKAAYDRGSTGVTDAAAAKSAADAAQGTADGKLGKEETAVNSVQWNGFFVDTTIYEASTLPSTRTANTFYFVK